MTDPELMLLDEPTAGLDLGGREDLIGRLTALAVDPDAPALVLVTHHVEEIPPGFTHALLLREGAVVAQGPVDRRSRRSTCRRRSASRSWCRARKAGSPPAPRRPFRPLVAGSQETLRNAR